MYTPNRHGRSGPSRSRRPSSSYSGSRRATSSQGRPQRRNHNAQGGQRSRGSRKAPSFNPSQFINTNPVEITEEVYEPTNSFGSFGLDERIVKTIASMNHTAPTPIQDQIIPEILNGHDVIGLAQTGTGKTAAFLIPLIQKTLQDDSRQTLILTPTRELAIQIEAELRRLSRGLRIFSVTCVGGVNIRPQITGLRRKNHFVIGTPGRVLDLIKRGNLAPAKLSTVVLDEADRMLDMGFITDMRAILKETPKDRETLFFSATMTGDAQKIVNDFLRDPVTVSVKKRDVTNSIEQDVISYKGDAKFDTLVSLLADKDCDRVLIFGSMKHSVERLSKQLTARGIPAASIHGNKNQSQRQRALADFKNGRVRVLVATDVAARGIHVDRVSHVVNYDLPNTFEDYVHRIGRTGRGSNRGKALTFVPQH